MAFTGSPTFEQLNDRTIRITGLQLASSNTSGTIGLSTFSGGAPDVTLPASFVAVDYSYAGVDAPLAASVQVNINMVSSAGLTNLMPSVSKTGVGGAFRITITNTSVSLTTQTMEIVITFSGGGLVTQPALVTAA
jgi:hypothetical protein